MSCLLETLGKVVHDTSASVAEKAYVEQLLMSGLDNAATNIPVSADPGRVSFSDSLSRMVPPSLAQACD